MGVLSEILRSKRAEIARLHAEPPAYLASAGTKMSPRSVSLRREVGGPLRLIAELKFRSPAAGPLSALLSVEERARAYLCAGAAMMSVLCDQPFFGGDYAHLTRVRCATDLPLLCKEFILDDIQLRCAAAAGADWVLLIVRCLSPNELAHLLREAHRLGLGALVEVHSPNEVAVALDAGATVIGVNARDLDTLEMKDEQAAEILASLPSSITSLHLSGIKSASDVALLARTRADGALIGEVLMRQEDPVPLLSSFTKAAKGLTL